MTNHPSLSPVVCLFANQKTTLLHFTSQIKLPHIKPYYYVTNNLDIYQNLEMPFSNPREKNDFATVISNSTIPISSKAPIS